MQFIALITDMTMLIIMFVVLISGFCAIKIALFKVVNTGKSINKYMLPAFPCDGIIFVLARDGLLYAVPEGTAVIKTDRVRAVHSGRIVRSCDNHGNFAYFDDVADGPDISVVGDLWSDDSGVSQYPTASLSEIPSLSETGTDERLII